jgi:NAD(P)-dependent dehydrogenase (short-subunit alcohol dehydrogenase family)
MIEETCNQFGEIEILVNNAGVGLFSAFYERTGAYWNLVLETNLKAVFLTNRAVAPGMIRLERGHIAGLLCLRQGVRWRHIRSDRGSWRKWPRMRPSGQEAKRWPGQYHGLRQ